MGTEVKHHLVNVKSLLVLRTNTKLFNMILKVLYDPILPASLPNLGHITDHANLAGPSDPPRCLVLPAKRSLPNCTLCLEFTYPFKNCPQPPSPSENLLVHQFSAQPSPPHQLLPQPSVESSHPTLAEGFHRPLCYPVLFKMKSEQLLG